MPFKVKMYAPGESPWIEEEVFETEEEAEEYGSVCASNWNQGAEDLYMMNPGDYPLPDEGPDWEVIEID